MTLVLEAEKRRHDADLLTSATLLGRLREGASERDWRRLAELYSPLIRSWACRCGVQDADADDLTQEVFAVLVRKLPEFSYDSARGSFRSWLRTVLALCLKPYWRSMRNRPAANGGSDLLPRFESLQDPDSDLSREWDRQHDRHVARRLLRLIEPDFAPATWKAFLRLTMDGAKASEVAAELGTSVNAVLIAKSRVLRRLHRESRLLLGATFS